jgi:DNA-binding SARP family transcriptional activator
MLKIRLLGRCSFENDAADVPDLKCSRARELLGYLACHSQRVLSREFVIDTLWCGLQQDQGKKALRQTLWKLQSTLSSYQITSGRPFIQAENDWIRLNPNSDIWLDVIRFEDLTKDYHLVRGHALSQVDLHKLVEAVSLYQGDLLEDCLTDWCLRERERLRDAYHNSLHRIMEHYYLNDSHDEASKFARMILSEDPCSEDACSTLMMILHQSGERTTALRQYQRCKDALYRELEVSPSKKLTKLRDLIRQDNSDGHIEGDSSLPSTSINLLKEIQSQISEICEDVRRLEEKIDREICKKKDEDIRHS